MYICRTFEGKKVDGDTIDHQHLSNIIHYCRIIRQDRDSELKSEFDILERRFNKLLLDYRPCARNLPEMKYLRDLVALHRDPNNDKSLRIVLGNRLIGEINCVSVAECNSVFTGNTVKEEVWRRTYDPTISQQYHISFEVLREYYRNNPSYRNVLKAVFSEAIPKDMPVPKNSPTNEFIISRKQLEILLLTAKDTGIIKALLDGWLPGYKEEEVKYASFGTLLLRQNNPLNVYTIQKDDSNNVGIYNITHGQWWGSKLPLNSLNYTKSGGSDKHVTVSEFKKLCGSHNHEIFRIFTEAMAFIKK